MKKKLLRALVPLTLLAFLFGCAQPVQNAESEEKKQNQLKAEKTADHTKKNVITKKAESSKNIEKTESSKNYSLLTELSALEYYTFERYQIKKFEDNFKKYDNYVHWEQYYHDYRYAYDTMFEKKIKIYKISGDIFATRTKLISSLEETKGAVTASGHIVLWSIYKKTFKKRFTDALGIVQAVCMMYYGGGIDAENLVQLYESGLEFLKDEYSRKEANKKAKVLQRELKSEIKKFDGYTTKIDTIQETSQAYYDRLMAFPSPTFKP